ncbi:Hypothetical predicted protein [Octopus vulgaris]|uniref:Uncharacterized protein n=1 Tax=Octopus vulgaris TaxID=6645 RepID=A0AA36F4S1_OCTVU|nr:Hypothetical predicted protein [Octopus vulgaris]
MLCSAHSHPRDLYSNAGSKRLRDRVNAKLIEGDVLAAVSLVASDDTVLYPTEDVLFDLNVHTSGPYHHPTFRHHTWPPRKSSFRL